MRKHIKLFAALASISILGFGCSKEEEEDTYCADAMGIYNSHVADYNAATLAEDCDQLSLIYSQVLNAYDDLCADDKVDLSANGGPSSAQDIINGHNDNLEDLGC